MYRSDFLTLRPTVALWIVADCEVLFFQAKQSLMRATTYEIPAGAAII
jgi:hypothetical protein